MLTYYRTDSIFLYSVTCKQVSLLLVTYNQCSIWWNVTLYYFLQVPSPKFISFISNSVLSWLKGGRYRGRLWEPTRSIFTFLVNWAGEWIVVGGFGECNGLVAKWPLGGAFWTGLRRKGQIKPGVERALGMGFHCGLVARAVVGEKPLFQPSLSTEYNSLTRSYFPLLGGILFS